MVTPNGQGEALAGAIKVALAAVEASKVPDRLVEAAFRESLRALLSAAFEGSTSALGGTPGSKARAFEQPSTEIPSGPTEEAVLKRVAEETGVTVDKLEQIFNVDDGVVKLIGQHTRYGSNTSEQARTVAQLVTVVRRVGMGIGDTPFEVIKQACEAKHCYDSKNFASKHLQGIDGFVVKGDGKGRRLEARGSGITLFGGLVDRVLGIA